MFSVSTCPINRKGLENKYYLDVLTARPNIKINKSGDAQTCDVAKPVGVPKVTPIGSQRMRECENSDATSAGNDIHLP